MKFPEIFFEAEVRDGFQISEMMKRAWAAQLEVLEIIDGICRKHRITYFATSGTLLGAVRHKGYIPWDDDIDIALLREDYNRLLKVLPEELPDGFVIAGMYADSKRLQEAADVQQLRVIADEEYWSFPKYLNRFHGFPYPRIGLDIFSLDYIPDDPEKAKIQIRLIHLVMWLLTHWEEVLEKGELEVKVKEIEAACKVQLVRDETLKNQLWRLVDRLSSYYDRESGSKVTNFSIWLLEKPYSMKRSWYDEIVEIPFEHITIPVPKNYHEILTEYYGDYMHPVKDAAMHNYPFYKTQQAELQRMFDESGIQTPIDEFCRNWVKANGLV